MVLYGQLTPLPILISKRYREVDYIAHGMSVIESWMFPRSTLARADPSVRGLCMHGVDMQMAA